MLLLLLLLPVAGSTDTESGIITKPISKCPHKGYFFHQEKPEEFGPCYLCFCKKGEKAYCWKKEVGGCNALYYSHQKRITRGRYRRSIGFSDIFFRDATRQVLGGNMLDQDECKPHKDSKSIGCPPADWCTGCMVCECDANGHWDCHLMSFCSTDKPTVNAKSNKNKKTFRTIAKERGLKKRFALRPLKNANNEKPKSKKIATKNENKNKKVVKKAIKKHFTAEVLSGVSVITKKEYGKKGKGQNAPLIIKRYISTDSPIKSPELLKYKSDTRKMAQILFKQYMLNKLPKKNRAPNDSKKSKLISIKNQKQNQRNARKPVNTNTKGHKDKFMVVSSKKRKDIKQNSKHIRKTGNPKGKKYKGSKFDNNLKRNKRDVQMNATEKLGNVSDIKSIETGKETENSTVYDNLITNATEISFTNNEILPTSLNNYAYIIDRYGITRIHNSESTLDTTEINTSTAITEVTNLTAKPYYIENENTMATEVTHSNGFNTTTAETDHPEKNISINDNITKYSNENRTANVSKEYGYEIKNINASKNFLTSTKIIQTPDKKSTRAKINNTLYNIQAVLEKFIHSASKNVSEPKPKNNYFTALRYLRKLFSKIFSHNRNRTAIDKTCVLDSLCENFGPCRVSMKKMGVVNYKIKKLMAETEKALSSIRIIKGLLELIENKNITERNAISKEALFKEHVKKLNAILKDNFVPGDQLTQTQATQINYIKSNTHVFIKAIAKFATTLNDIINLIKSENEKHKNDSISIKNKKRSNRQRDAVDNIKTVLIKYNLLQNTFFQRMYDALTNIETKLKRKNNNVTKANIQHVKNNTLKSEIDKYVSNINYNVNKLKELVVRFGPKERRKRHIMRDDDAVEYLLTLMEYLLKRNNPLDTPPVNDGIDLLIDAIKNAPDIKPIEKNVLKYMSPEIQSSTEKSTELNEDASNLKISKDSIEDSISNAKYKSDEVLVNNNVITKKNKDSTVSPTTEKHVISDLSELFTEYPSKVYMATYDIIETTEIPFFVRQPKTEATTVAIPKSTTKISDNKNKVDTYTVIMDEENMKLIQKLAADLETVTQSKSNPVLTTTETIRMRHFSPHINERLHKGVPKTKLDLINEAYEQEIKAQRTKHTTARPSKPTRKKIKGETGKRDKTITSNKGIGNDISSITKEISDGDKRLRNDADVIYRKQMDLLNSLDYGTDKPVADDTDPKDSSPLDRIKSREENPTTNYILTKYPDEDLKQNARSKLKEDNDLVAAKTIDSNRLSFDATRERGDLSDVFTDYPSKVYMATENAYEKTIKPSSEWPHKQRQSDKPKADILIKLSNKNASSSKNDVYIEKDKGIETDIVLWTPLDLNSLDYGLGEDVIDE